MTKGELTKSLGDDVPRSRDKGDVMSLSKDLEHENVPEETLHDENEEGYSRLCRETGVVTVEHDKIIDVRVRMK